MGKGSSSAPSYPDPVATAQAQGAMNKETAIAQGALNRINQYTPYGNLEYKETGYDSTAGVPTYSRYVTLSPEQQKIFNKSQNTSLTMGQTASEQMKRLQQSLAQPISYEGAPQLMSSADPATQAKAEEALMSRINPQLDRDRSALEAKLASQGLALNSEAYNTAMDSANRQANDARSQAVLQALQYGQNATTLNNQARQQYIQEAASVRNQPLNEISALISGSQVQSPQFSSYPTTSVANTNYSDLVNQQYASQYANWQAQQQAKNAMYGGLFGLGSTALTSFW